MISYIEICMLVLFCGIASQVEHSIGFENKQDTDCQSILSMHFYKVNLIIIPSMELDFSSTKHSDIKC